MVALVNYIYARNKKHNTLMGYFLNNAYFELAILVQTTTDIRNKLYNNFIHLRNIKGRQMKAVRELKSFLPEIYMQRKISRQDVHFIFGKIREILENKRNYQSTYPELNLFCNWCFHSELSASKTIFNALIRISKSITDALDKNMNEEEKVIRTKNFISVSANILNIPKLRVAMKSILESFYVDARITNEKAWWDACLQLLLQEVSDKPLKFPENIVSGEVKKEMHTTHFKS